MGRSRLGAENGRPIFFLTIIFSFHRVSGGRRPFPPFETGLLTLGPSRKRNADFEIIQAG